MAHEACDIIRFATRALIQLVIIYRDYMDGTVYPLLPWLHSTATCEHVFGICRQIVKDFTLEEFNYMVPKLNVRLREHSFFSHTSDGKARASGYNHTYTDNRRIDLIALATYPTDNEIQRAANVAYEEAHGLWETLGVDNIRSYDPLIHRLPSVRSWFNIPFSTVVEGGAVDEGGEDTDSDGVSDVEGPDVDRSDVEDPPSERGQILAAMESLETLFTSVPEDNQNNALAYAATALSIQETMDM